MAAQTFSGARARVLIDGKIIGFCGGLSGSESIDYEPVDVLNLLEVKEFVPVAYRATLSAQMFRIIGNSIKKQGIMPRGNDLDILTAGDLTVMVEDKLNPGQIAAQFTGVKCQEHSFDITARGLVSENVNFVAIRVKDESEL
jgi:hypothetical protein